jgi:hypothetical protein
VGSPVEADSVFQVRANHVRALLDDVGHDLPLIVGRRLAFLDGDGAFGAMAQTSAQPVAA